MYSKILCYIDMILIREKLIFFIFVEFEIGGDRKMLTKSCKII